MDCVPDIQPRTVFDQNADHRLMACQGGLMQGRGMRVVSRRIVAVGILARIEQEANDRQMPVLRGESQCAVTVLRAGARKKAAIRIEASTFVAAPTSRAHRL